MTGDERKKLRQDNIAFMAMAAGGKIVEAFDHPAYETAFLGVTTDLKAVYDYDRMIADLRDTECMGRREAGDYIRNHHNMMKNQPIIVHMRKR